MTRKQQDKEVIVSEAFAIAICRRLHDSCRQFEVPLCGPKRKAISRATHSTSVINELPSHASLYAIAQYVAHPNKQRRLTPGKDAADGVPRNRCVTVTETVVDNAFQCLGQGNDEHCNQRPPAPSLHLHHAGRDKVFQGAIADVEVRQDTTAARPWARIMQERACAR